MVETFSRACGPLERLEPRLATALGDLLARPGSLTRATTSYLLGIEFGMTGDTARALACGIEYLHTASLVFDDLPAMDDSRMRRSGVCIHVTHGEGIAMLAALALINRGYALLWQAVAKAPAAKRQSAADLVESCLGLDGLVGGQALDLRGWRNEQDVTAVTDVALRKTAALLRLVLVLPALTGRGSAREVQLLERLATLLGLAYQIADDLKDSMLDCANSGKSSGRDAELGRPSMVGAEGLPAAMRRLRRVNEVAARIEARLPGPPQRWGMLALLRVGVPIALAGPRFPSGEANQQGPTMTPPENRLGLSLAPPTRAQG